jgi:hypothetical protein
MKIMGRQFTGSFLLILLGGLALTVGAQTTKSIAEIQKIYNETNEKIAECEENGENSSTFLSEMVVNKNNGSYPAVGIFRTVYKFYYTYGNREKDPYPNRLLKITVATKRSDRKEYAEFLFNPLGQLMFYFEKNDGETDRLFYFAGEKLIKAQKGGRTTSLKDREEIGAVKMILSEKRKLTGIFRDSLKY